MSKLSPTDLETILYGSQAWTQPISDNFTKLNDTLLKLSELLDVELTSLTDGDILAWDAAAGKWKNVPY